jgi:hypothetical protein
MKYIITESQLNLISELERHWMDFEYEDQYNKFKDMVVPFIVDDIVSYDDMERRGQKTIALYNSDGEIMMIFMIYKDQQSGELFYDRKYDRLFADIFPHPIWVTNGKYFVSDAFESMFPDYKVADVNSSNIA